MSKEKEQPYPKRVSPLVDVDRGKMLEYYKKKMNRAGTYVLLSALAYCYKNRVNLS